VRENFSRRRFNHRALHGEELPELDTDLFPLGE
jgi:hypothetical protein